MNGNKIETLSRISIVFIYSDGGLFLANEIKENMVRYLCRIIVLFSYIMFLECCHLKESEGMKVVGLLFTTEQAIAARGRERRRTLLPACGPDGSCLRDDHNEGEQALISRMMVSTSSIVSL